jgi:hypothetical protein
VNYIIVREDECGLQIPFALECRQLVKFLELSSEVLKCEVTTNFKLIAVHLTKVWRESGQWMTTRTTNTDQKYVTTFQFKNTVDLGHVNDSISEKYNIHLLHFRLVVVGC